MAEHNQQFDSFTEWCNKASSWLTRHPSFHPKDFRAICFDTKGRLCRCGADFVRARDGDAFPVKWLWPDQVASLSAQHREPVVKQLDWIERKGVTGTFDANTSIGHYIATTTDDNRGMWFIVGQTTGEYMQPDIDAVRAAAQADYEQRIRSAIVIIPVGAGESSDAVAQGDCSTVFLGETAQGLTASETHDGGSSGPSPLAVKPGSSDPASGRSQPSPDVGVDELALVLDRLVNAPALKGVRELVAGWNGENRHEGPYKDRHPNRLGATLPKTNCGAVYELDEAMQSARAILDRLAGGRR